MDGAEIQLCILFESSFAEHLRLTWEIQRSKAHELLNVWLNESRFPQLLIEFIFELNDSLRPAILEQFLLDKISADEVVDEMLGIEHSASRVIRFARYPNRNWMPQIHRKVKVALSDLRGLRSLCREYSLAQKSRNKNSELVESYRDAICDQLKLLEPWFTDPAFAIALNLVWISVKRKIPDTPVVIMKDETVRILRSVSGSYRLGPSAARAIQRVGEVQLASIDSRTLNEPPAISDIWDSVKTAVGRLTERDPNTTRQLIDWQTTINSAGVLVACLRDFNCANIVSLSEALQIARAANSGEQQQLISRRNSAA